jgi:hypothetical protein
MSNRPPRPGDVARYGLLQDAPNPRHFGQNLIVLTPKGRALVRKFIFVNSYRRIAYGSNEAW